MSMLEGIYFPSKNIAVNDDKYFIPASNTKIITSFFAIRTLGDNHIFSSKFKVEGKSLYIKIAGNPLITVKDLEYLVENISNEVDEIIVDHRFLYPSPRPPGWCIDDTGKSYAPPVSEVNFEFNRKEEIKDGKTLTYSVEKPLQYFLYYLKDLISKRFGLKMIKHKYGKWNGGEDFAVRTIAEILKIMNKNSENSIAEMLLLNSGKAMGAKGLEASIWAMEKLLKKNGIDGFKIYDGSGLSYYNIIKPRTLVKILDLLADERIFIESLPVGGKDGTLSKRLSPKVIAKTGTLHNVQNLSGYLNGETFSIMLNGVENQDLAREYIDTFLSKF